MSRVSGELTEKSSRRPPDFHSTFSPPAMLCRTVMCHPECELLRIAMCAPASPKSRKVRIDSILWEPVPLFTMAAFNCFSVKPDGPASDAEAILGEESTIAAQSTDEKTSLLMSISQLLSHH